MGKIVKRFENGSVNVELDSGRKIKLTQNKVEDLRDLLGGRDPERLALDNVGGWKMYWQDSEYFLMGPDGEAKREWAKSPEGRHLHDPWLTLAEFVEILGVVNDVDLSEFVDFVRGSRHHEGSRIWHRWHLLHQERTTYRMPAPPKGALRLIDKETGEEIIVETGLEHVH